MGGDVPVEVYNTNGDAKMALSNGEIDALVADLPTAFAVADELRDGLMVGQLPSAADDVEQFGIVLDKDSPLTRCVRGPSTRLREDGTLDRLEHAGWPMPARLPYWPSPPGPGASDEQAGIALCQVAWSTPGGGPTAGPGAAGTPCSPKQCAKPAVAGRRDRGRRLIWRRRGRRARGQVPRGG